MRFRLLAVGQKMPGWVQQGFEEYAKRLSGPWRLELEEIAPARRTASNDVERWRREEGERLLDRRSRGELLVALDERGKAPDTRGLAQRIQKWQLAGDSAVALAVGGPDGLDAPVLAAADWRWSLGPLTLPHPLVRVILAEQLYRAWSLLEGHPYHRG